MGKGTRGGKCIATPSFTRVAPANWIPACAGMTRWRGIEGKRKFAIPNAIAPNYVTPAKAGAQTAEVEFRLRGNDAVWDSGKQKPMGAACAARGNRCWVGGRATGNAGINRLRKNSSALSFCRGASR